LAAAVRLLLSVKTQLLVLLLLLAAVAAATGKRVFPVGLEVLAVAAVHKAAELVLAGNLFLTKAILVVVAHRVQAFMGQVAEAVLEQPV
jgi:hypothetical protein